MKIASYYPPEELANADLSGPSHFAHTMEFLQECAPLISRYHVFASPRFRRLIESKAIPNVELHSITDLSMVAGGNEIDVWHDLGYGLGSRLLHLRKELKCAFSLTTNATGQCRRTGSLNKILRLGETDAVVYPTEQKLLQDRKRGNEFFGPESEGNAIPPQMVSILPGINAKRASNFAKEDARALLGVPAEVTLVLCYHSFSSFDFVNYQPILEVVYQNLGYGKTAHLIIAGKHTASAHKSLQRHITSHRADSKVTVVQNPANAAVNLLFAAADVYFTVADDYCKETIYNLLYAMGRKLPVIAFTSCSAEALVTHLKSGILVSKQHHCETLRHFNGTFQLLTENTSRFLESHVHTYGLEELEEGFKLLLQDKETRVSMGEGGFQKLIDNPPERVAQAYVELWKRLRLKAKTGCADWSITKGKRIDGIENSSSELAEYDSFKVCLTAKGRQFIKTEKWQIPEEYRDIIWETVIQNITILAARDYAIKDLIKEISRKNLELNHGPKEDVIRCHILWCLKYGVLYINKERECLEVV